jgi:hypothetical protein
VDAAIQQFNDESSADESVLRLADQDGTGIKPMDYAKTAGLLRRALAGCTSLPSP